MRTLKNISIEESSLDTGVLQNLIEGIVVGESANFEGADLRLRGSIYNCPSYCDGTTIVTSPIAKVFKKSEDSFLVTTVTGVTYFFSILRKYGVPTLNFWRFKDEYYSFYVEEAIIHHKEVNFGGDFIEVFGEASEIPGRREGSLLRVSNAVSIAPALEIPDAVVLITANESRYLLPLSQRVGFLYGNAIGTWHFLYDLRKTKEVQEFMRELNLFLKKDDGVKSDEFLRNYIDVPADYKLRFKTKKGIFDVIEKFIKISYLGRTKYYAAIDEAAGKYIDFNVFAADRKQRRVFEKLDSKKAT